MICPGCGDERCDGSCEDAVFGLSEDCDTVVGLSAIDVEDVARLQRAGTIDFDVDGLRQDRVDGGPQTDSLDFDLDLDDLVEPSPQESAPGPDRASPPDPFAALEDPLGGPLVMLDGTPSKDGAAGATGPSASADLAPSASADLAPSASADLAPESMAPQAVASTPDAPTPVASVAIPRAQKRRPRAVAGPQDMAQAVELSSEQIAGVEFAVVLGKFLVKRVRVSRRPIIVGRDPGSDVVLDNPSVSRRHCEIVLKGGADTVRDTGSSNGTLVDGRPIVEAELRPGNVIGVGKFYLIYQPSQAQLATLAAQNPAAGRYSMGANTPRSASLPVAGLAPLPRGPKGFMEFRDDKGHPGQRVALTEAETLMGSGADVPLRANGALVAKHHAVITRTSKGFTIKGLGWHRVTVNGHGKKSHELKEGDTVKVGKGTFVFRSR